MTRGKLTVGVLALQGDFSMHLRAFAALNVATREVRTPADLEGLWGLVVPGGESTTMTKLLFPEFRAALEKFCATHPVWGTCAGMIMLSKMDSDPRVKPLGLLSLDVERNGFGRQVHSFEADLRVAPEIGEEQKPLHGIFIRAPRITKLGDQVKPLVFLNDEPVCVRQKHWLASSFHPELTHDLRLHNYFLGMTHDSTFHLL
jgi:pyridoxal 5'-phosphate synthase pdxT subunit